MKKNNKLITFVWIIAFAVILLSISGCKSTATTGHISPSLTKPTITIYNETGYFIYFIYVSSASTENWGSDLLGTNVLAPGQAFVVTVPVPGRYDIRLVDSDGDSYTFWNQNVARVAPYEIKVDLGYLD